MYKIFRVTLVTLICVFSSVAAFTLTHSFFKQPPINTTNNKALKKPIEAEVEAIEYAENINKIDVVDEDATVSVFLDEEKIGENTRIVYEYYYVADGRTEKAEQSAPYSLLTLTRKQLLEKIEGWRVVSFSSKEVVLRKTIEATPTGSYILGIWDDRVAVFYGGQTIGTGLMEVTDTPVSSLSLDEHERLSEGIIIRDETELMKALEDYGS